MAPWRKKDDASDRADSWGDGSNAPDNVDKEFTDTFAGSDTYDSNMSGK